MSVQSLTTRRRLLILGLTLGAFVAAEVLRDVNTKTSTLVSMAGWVLFLVLFLTWGFEGKTWRSSLKDFGRVALLTLLSAAVLSLYYARSEALDAGAHVDSAYTYIGLKRFAALDNPITFAGRTPSYAQFPMMLLTHLPALAVGFGRLGAFSVVFGMLLQIAFLFALVTKILAPASLRVQALIVILMSALFSNRLLVLSYNLVGYTIPAICLGLIFLVVVDDEAVPDPGRTVGGLLALSLLHYYTGFAMVLPLCMAWLLLARTPIGRIRRFLAQNPVLLAVLALSGITLATHPELLMERVSDVTLRVASDQGLSLLPSKLEKSWNYLTSTYASLWFRVFFLENGGDWHMLNVPPLAGLLVPLVSGSWFLSFWSFRRRCMRYLIYLGVFGVLTLVLSVSQLLLTDFQHKRSFTVIFALMIAGFSFVLRVPRLGWKLKLLAVSYAVAFGIYNYVDLAVLRGKVYGTEDHAHRSQQSMEAIAALLARGEASRLGAGRIYVVVDKFFPLQSFYLEALKRYRVPIHVVEAKKFCSDRAAVEQAASVAGCAGFLLVAHSKQCRDWRAPAGESAGRAINGDLYESLCGKSAERDRERCRISIQIGRRK